MPNLTDDKFLRDKESLVQNLEDIVEFLGDEDAKKVTLTHTVLTRHVSTVSANSSSEDHGEHTELEADAEEIF